MDNSTPQQISKDKVATQLYFASIYFITVGVLYLWGYWLPFGVNILEYLSLTDVLKVTAYPMATALVLTAIGAALGEALVDRNSTNGVFISEDGSFTKIGRFLRNSVRFLAFMYVVCTITLFFYGPVEKWAVLPTFIAVPIYIFARNTGFLRRLIPHDSPRSIVIYVLAALPPFAYGHGLLAANRIQTGQRFSYVASEIAGYSSASEPQKQLRLIGHANDTIFLLDPARTATIVLKLETGKPLVLMQYNAAAIPQKPSNAASTGSK